MQNQASPAQLLFPTVPNSYCPSGDWASIFNSFITLYLNNGTVNIPFLNEVTPQQITSLQQSLLEIQNKLNAVNWQAGQISVTPATTSGTAVTSTVAVTLPTAINSANYNISGYFTYPSGGTDTGLATWGIVSGSITTTGFTVWFSNESTAITSFTWQVSNLGAL
jgi:hypothetical protein